jgi:hypothetical protein
MSWFPYPAAIAINRTADASHAGIGPVTIRPHVVPDPGSGATMLTRTKDAGGHRDSS